MAKTISVACNIPDADVRGINAALTNLQKSLGEYSAQAPRIAACYFCDAMRKRTKVARTFPLSSEWKARPIKHTGFITIEKNGRQYKIPTPSPYITRPGALIVHRWQLVRHYNSPNVVTYPVGVYSHIKRNKRGKLVTNIAAEKAEIKKNHLKITNRGLAKKSWNLAKGKLGGNTSGDVVYKRRKNDRRDPTDAVDGIFKQLLGLTKTSASARVVNELGYIMSAMKPGSLEESVSKAALKIAWRSAKAQGMTPDEAAKYARKLLEDVRKMNAA